MTLMAPQIPDDASPAAVLVSGGLDSAILLAESLHHSTVYPLYIRFGLSWESAELRYLRRFLEAIHGPSLRPLVILDQPVADLYGRHWSITGTGVPDAHTADAAVFLPGRNVLLLAKSMLWCHLHAVSALSLAPLEGNPFPDATPAFFAAYEAVVNQAIGGQVRLRQPYRGLSKSEVLRRGRDLPLEWTFSCIQPVKGSGGPRHCGVCNKCAERRKGFRQAGLVDPTEYARIQDV